MKTYFILDEWNRAVKIGRSVNPAHRLKQLQTGHASILRLLHVVDGNHEKALHARWRHLRISGEWFKVEDDLLLYLGVRDQQQQMGAIRLAPMQQKEARKPGKSDKAPARHKKTANIPYVRHVGVMNNAFRRYRSEAALITETLAPAYPPLPLQPFIPILEHQQALNEARKYYAEQLQLT